MSVIEAPTFSTQVTLRTTTYPRSTIFADNAAGEAETNSKSKKYIFNAHILILNLKKNL